MKRAELAALHDKTAERLEEAGLRYTPRRRLLVEALARAARPVTIPELHRADAGLSQSTVYRNLTGMEAAGVVRRVAGPGEFARYELAEGLTSHHHHLVCTSCGTVQDVEVSAAVERALGRELAAVARSSGFQVDAHQIDLLGRCARC
jgi:Fe2+ or Zn2+ uptake regulation protein